MDSNGNSVFETARVFDKDTKLLVTKSNPRQTHQLDAQAPAPLETKPSCPVRKCDEQCALEEGSHTPSCFLAFTAAIQEYSKKIEAMREKEKSKAISEKQNHARKHKSCQSAKSNTRDTPLSNLPNLDFHPTSSLPSYYQYMEAAQTKLADLEQDLKQAQGTATKLYQDMMLHYRDPSDIYNAWMEAVVVTFEYVTKMERTQKEMDEISKKMEEAMKKKVSRSAKKAREVEAKREKEILLRNGEGLEVKLENARLKVEIRELEPRVCVLEAKVR